VSARTGAGKGLVAVAVLALGLAACDGGDDSDRSSASSSTTRPERAPLSILVTNDDGYAAEGIDIVVEALRRLPGVELTVVAPAANSSGTGGRTTQGVLTASEQTTASGFPATAVEGFPADAIRYAIDEVLTAPPDLVVSGINQGQNLGPISSISGTVGAAAAAVAAGMPALAASQGLGEPPDYASAARLVVEWVRAKRAALAAGDSSVVVVSLNVPTCPTGEIRGLRQEPLAERETGIGTPPDCQSTATTFADDVEAFLAGFATATELGADGRTVTTSTTWPQPR
jgi:5'-nucleotidase